MLLVPLAAACAPPLPPTPRQPRVTALAVVAAFDTVAVDSLWPGFQPRAVPLAIYDGERTWLVRYPQPAEGFTPVAARTGIQQAPGRHRRMRANTTVSWDGVTTATLLLAPEVNDDPRSWAGIAVHESFHAFSRTRYRHWGANEAELFRYPVEDAEALALRRVETESLRRSLTAATLEGAACWAREALAVRTVRMDRLGAGSGGYERENERFEGLADYVELRATGDTLRLPAAGYPPATVRLRSYAIGTVLALLLDRFQPGWRADLDGDPTRYLDDLLAASVSRVVPATCGQPLDRDSVRARAGRDIVALLAHRGTARHAFLSRPGWTVVVLAGRDRLAPTGFDPLNVEVISPEQILHLRYLRLSLDDGWVEVLDRESLTTGEPSDPFFGGVRSVLITGLPSAPVLRDSSGVLLLRADGLEAAFPGGRVSWGDHTLHVILQ